jgi:hypothetical protein
MMKNLVVICSLMIAMLASCTYKSKQGLASTTVCTTTGVTYNNFVSGYLTSNGCVACHGGSQYPTLASYTDVKIAAANPEQILVPLQN